MVKVCFEVGSTMGLETMVLVAGNWAFTTAALLAPVIVPDTIPAIELIPLVGRLKGQSVTETGPVIGTGQISGVSWILSIEDTGASSVALIARGRMLVVFRVTV